MRNILLKYPKIKLLSFLLLNLRFSIKNIKKLTFMCKWIITIETEIHPENGK